MTFSSNKHKRQTVTNYKQHKSIVPHDSTKPPKNPRTTNACTYHPGTHTPCTHAHTNNNPSDQAHPHTHKNDTNSCKLFELRTIFVRISYEIRTKFVTTTFTVRIEGRNSYEIHTKFARISYEFRASFVRVSYHFCRTLHEEPHQHHLCMYRSPHTHTHFPIPAPPAPTHTYTHTHTPHRHTHQGPLHCSLRGILTAQCQIDSGRGLGLAESVTGAQQLRIRPLRHT